MTQLLATNFANAFECSYPDIQLVEAVCAEYENHIATATSGEDIIVIIFKDYSILIIDNTSGLCYEFTRPEHAIKFLTKTPELASKIVENTLPKNR